MPCSPAAPGFCLSPVLSEPSLREVCCWMRPSRSWHCSGPTSSFSQSGRTRRSARGASGKASSPMPCGRPRRAPTQKMPARASPLHSTRLRWACGMQTSFAAPRVGRRATTSSLAIPVRRPDGGLRSIVVDGRVYRAEDGTPIRIAGVVTDVTERRRIEGALHQTQRLQTIGTIAAGVAHNFNNLLTIVLGNLDLASRQGSNIERLPLYLAAATMAAERGANLTWQLLAFARQQPLRPEPIEPSRQLRDLSTLIGES